jgi:hypothetical protein
MAADDPEKAMDVTDESCEEEEADKDTKTLTSELLKNPAVMNALQGRLDAMAGSASGYIKVFFLIFRNVDQLKHNLTYMGFSTL